MVIETDIRRGIEDYGTTISPAGDLISAVEDIAEKKFRKRQIGRFIAKVIATTSYHRNSYEFRPERAKALRGLSEFDISSRQLTRFVAKLSTDFKADHEPLVKSFLIGMTVQPSILEINQDHEDKITYCLAL